MEAEGTLYETVTATAKATAATKYVYDGIIKWLKIKQRKIKQCKIKQCKKG